MYAKVNNIYIHSDVIAQYAGIATTECSGVLGMSMLSIKDGVYRLLKKESLKKGIEVKIDKNEISLDIHIIVIYGVPITSIIESILSSVSYSLKSNLGLDIKTINVFVDGIKVNN